MEENISVVIPVFNGARFVKFAIESVLTQTYTHWELIVVDDGSTDDTASIIQHFSQNIQYIRQENQGLAAARNTGIRNAHNKLICLLDADDRWRPHFLETMKSLQLQDPEAAIYYCCAQAIDENGNQLPQIFGYRHKKSESLLNTLLRANFLIPSTIMMNYSTIPTDEYFDRDFRRLQDWELWIRLLKKGYYFRGLSEVLVDYRIHKESLSMDPQGGQKAAKALVTKHFGSEDQEADAWSLQKKRAFGGTYRYHSLSAIQKQGDWVAGSKFLSRALEVDPSLALDLDFFYELAFSGQPVGLKNAAHYLDAEKIFASIDTLLLNVFSQQLNERLKKVRSQVYGTANYAMGLVAYNTGRKSLCRFLFFKAIYFRPKLLFNSLIITDIFKSLISLDLISQLKQIKKRHRSEVS